jgi:hypothetical protein
MARASRIYIVQGIDGFVHAAFTVKRELLTFLFKRAEEPWMRGVFVTSTGDGKLRTATDLTIPLEQYLKENG